MALSASGLQKIKITADSPTDFVHRVVGLLGNLEKAGVFFKVHFVDRLPLAQKGRVPRVA